MATIALSAVGMAIGGSIGGTVLGLSTAVIGRAVGAAIGRRIDQKLLGGSQSVETGRIDRFRVTGAAEGAPVQQVYGRMRVAGQVIWASQFSESTKTSGGGKGAPAQPKTTTYRYHVSLAIALCEGTVARIGRIWADGEEIAPSSLNLRLYPGTEDQLPDPKISAVEGPDHAPAYRGTAYVVLEDLALGQFGNRIPQLTFEVMRSGDATGQELSQIIKAAAILPGAGEYGFAVSQVHLSQGFGHQTAVNTNTPLGGSDFTVAMDALQGELPACASVIVPVTWFGDDLRCGECTIRPKVTQKEADASAMPWRAGGIARSAAQTLPEADGQPVFGGTPADRAVIEALGDLNARGLSPVMLPWLQFDALAGNTLTDPATGAVGQPALAWRGALTLSRAPGVSGSPDQTTVAAAEIAAFLGSATPAHFFVNGTTVTYSGPASDWGYRRFILHHAHLCAAAGGVSAFLIGSQMAGLTCIRDASGNFPFVDGLRALAADVRSILGPDCKISYAAHHGEYHGYQPIGTEDKLFPLDALWADPMVDFVGIDAALPLSDWREGADHADAAHGTIYDQAYLAGNVAGGEGFDWRYPTPEARAVQRRYPISDTHGAAWMWRDKDFAGWWGNWHYPRVSGVPETAATDWQPGMKPLWFTAIACPASDKAANGPGPVLPGGSDHRTTPTDGDGGRDDLMQLRYYQAILGHFANPAQNPLSDVYGGRMVDTDHLHVWGWDARPYPFFPGNRATWPDGADYATGFGLNGRATHRTLGSVVTEICAKAGVASPDVRDLHGILRGYTAPDTATGRAALQPLMLAYGFDATEAEGTLRFRSRAGRTDHICTDDSLARDPETGESLRLTRAAPGDMVGRVQLTHIDADGNYDVIAAEAIMPDAAHEAATRDEAALALTRAEGQATANRWLQEARIAQESARFALPPSQHSAQAGDIVAFGTGADAARYRIDRIEEAGLRLIEATRIAPDTYRPQTAPDAGVVLAPHVGPLPAEMLFMDLPLLTGDEVPHAPYIAATGQPWPGTIAVYGAPQDSDYALQAELTEAATIGVTTTALAAGPVGIWDRQAALEVTLVQGTLVSATPEAVLAGANTLAIGDGSVDGWEIVQFTQASPLGDRRYALSGLLRGQAGSRALMPASWPEGSRVVLMDGTAQQVPLAAATRGLARHFRYGPAGQALSDPSYRYAVHAFAGNGLRPYPVAHLRAVGDGAGGITLSWIRCTRIDGDLWADGDVPLGETTEAYLVRVTQGGAIRREVTVTTPTWTYGAADLAAEVGGTPYKISVAQVSDRFGPGPFTGRDFT